MSKSFLLFLALNTIPALVVAGIADLLELSSDETLPIFAVLVTPASLVSLYVLYKEERDN